MKLKVNINGVSTLVETTDLPPNTKEELTVIIEPPVAAVQTTIEVPALHQWSPVVGRDNDYFYYFFQSALHVGQNHGKGFFIEQNYCKLLLKGSAPLTVSSALTTELAIFPKELMHQKEASGKENPDDLAREYLKDYSLKRYNNTNWYFNPDLQRWIELKETDYNTFNIFLSMKTRRYAQKTKRAIMDSLIPYLYDPNFVEQVTDLKTHLLLFKNKRVLDLKTMKSRAFTEKDFIFHELDANWYDDNDPRLDKLQPNEFLVALLDGVSGVRKDDKTDPFAPQRKQDLLSYIGFTLTNESKEESTLIMYGTGRNGKSTLASLIYELKDSSFAIVVETFLRDAHYSAGFYNKRFLFFDELQPGAVDEKFIGRFKALTGSNILNIRPMQKEPYDVKTNFVTYITTNELSEEFLKDRALVRRTKVMNAMKPAPAWTDPRADFNKSVRAQVNKDWLANYCIRKFIHEETDISNLFVYDMKDWAVKYNEAIRKLLTSWKGVGWADYHANLSIRNADLVHHLLTASGGIKQMSSGRSIGVEPATTFFDEQMNLLLINLLNLRNARCENGYVKYDGNVKEISAQRRSGDYILIDASTDNEKQEFALIFKDSKDKRLTWRINQRQEVNIRYVLTEVFGWDPVRDGENFVPVIAKHIAEQTRFHLEDVKGSIVIAKPLFKEKKLVGTVDGDDSAVWFEEVINRLDEIPVSQFTRRQQVLNAHRHLLDQKQMLKLMKRIRVEYDEYNADLDLGVKEMVDDAE